jgi:hypothetical protein
MAKRKKTGGRRAGTPNKITALLKDAILQAAERAGDKEGLVGYLTVQAKESPGPFLTLLGKVLPMQVGVDPGSAGLPIVSFTTVYEDGRPVERPVVEVQRRIVAPPIYAGPGAPIRARSDLE